MGPSTTVVAIEGGPDWTTVDGRSTVGVDSAPIDGFALEMAPLQGSDAVCSTLIEELHVDAASLLSGSQILC